MWLSRVLASGGNPGDFAAEAGVVTIGGASPSVMLSGEVRDVEILSCGGLFWRPEAGDEVLTMATPEGRRFLAFSGGEAPEGISAGEVFIKTKSAGIHLKADGGMELFGDVFVSGRLFVNGFDVGSTLASLSAFLGGGGDGGGDGE